ncbi:MAG: GAF domain-containing sensor histidine kinase [Thermotogota bacterium]
MSTDIDIKTYIESFEEMSQLFQALSGEEEEKSFMDKLLNIAIKSIPESECGSIWKIEGTLYRPVAGYCYDDEILNKMEIPFEDSYIYKHLDEEIHETYDIAKFNKSVSEFYKVSQMLHKKNDKLVTLIVPLRIKNKLAGHIYIDNFKVSSFSETSKRILKTFSNFASTFMTLMNLREKEKEANEMNSVYLSFITHELRTPLTSIIGFSETVLSDPDMSAAEMRKMMRKIYASAKHLNSLIEDISTFKKLNKDTKMNIDEINFKKLLFDSISIVEPMTSPDVELNIKYETEIPDTIETDATKLRQVLVNIIGNSVKYTDYGYVDIYISYSKKKKMFSIKIEDSGPGIPEEKLKDIFKPFVRLSKDKPGSGLGLAIVKKTIKKLKGSIHMNSKEGYGTTTELNIPLSLKK